MKRKMLIIGSGAREHALAKSFKDSGVPCEIFFWGQHANPGLVDLSYNYRVDQEHKVAAIGQYAKAMAVDFAICGPEAPLAAGIADALAALNIPCIGPKRSMARIESSKGFARDLLFSISPDSLPHYWSFNEPNQFAVDKLRALSDRYVIKADGLAGGKGVKVAGDHFQTTDEAVEWMRTLNSPFLIEEKLEGHEFSLMSFTDGQHIIHMPIIQDYKRAYEYDQGPNTGGMGSFTLPSFSMPFLSDADVSKAERINELTIDALQREQDDVYQGILYGGFMKTPQGLKLIEYNCRFGDPEALNVLALLDEGLLSVCQHIIDQTLDQISIHWHVLATVCKYLVPQGYPDSAESNGVIGLPANGYQEMLYYGSVVREKGQLLMQGSRALAVLGVAETLADAESRAESLANQIEGPVFHRSDIGQ